MARFLSHAPGRRLRPERFFTAFSLQIACEELNNYSGQMTRRKFAST
jgi:hypothetical protein